MVNGFFLLKSFKRGHSKQSTYRIIACETLVSNSTDGKTYSTTRKYDFN